LRVQTALIEVDDLIKLVNLALLSGRVKNGKIVSMLLIGDTEVGKTQILEVFMNLSTVIWANDLSAKIIVDEIAPRIEQGKTHVLIPDLLKVLGHQKVVVKNTITMLESGMEEGLKNLMFYGTRKEFAQAVRFGVIAAITRPAYRARENYWRGIGFVGRCVPVSFSYSDDTIRKIHDHIRNGFPAKIIEIITGRSVSVEIPAIIAERVQDLTIARTPFSTGFRLHKQLRSLVQAEALYHERNSVVEDDFEEVRRLSRFINVDFNRI
jgi:hypothetical protein